MRLRVWTPGDLVVDEADVVRVRAEDASGAFGIQRGHTEFVTALAVSVLSWHETSGRERHVAVRGGVLRVRSGEVIEVATRDAVAGDDMETLGHAVLARMRADAEAEAKARTRAAQLHVAFVRRLEHYLRGAREPAALRFGDGTDAAHVR